MLSRRCKANLGSYLAAIVLLHAIFAWNARYLIHRGYPDFTIFYSAAKIIREGSGGQLYDEATQFRVQREFASGVLIRQGALPYNHPPFEALLFIPFTWLPYGEAFVAWDLINLGILFALPYLLRPHIAFLRDISPASCLLASLAFFPVFVALLQGQDMLLLVLLFALAFIALKNNSDLTAGCWLGLGLFRFHLLFPVFFALLWQRRTRAIYSFLSTAVALVGISVLTVGWKAAMTYPNYVLRIEKSMGQRGTVVPLNMPDLHGLLAIAPLSSSAKLAGEILVALISLGLVIGMAIRWKRSPGTVFNLGFCLCLLTTVITAYHGFAYDLSLLILVTAIVTDYVLENRASRWNAIALLAPAFVLTFTPLQTFLWFRKGAFGLIVVVLLFWFWAISRASSSTTRELASKPVKES